MKFSNGFWVNQKGFDIYYAVQAFEITKDINSIKVIATTKYIESRKRAMSGPVFDITFKSTAKDVIKVTIDHFKGGLDNFPKYELNENRGFTPQINEYDTYWELISGDTKVVIVKGEWDVKYFYGERLLTNQGWRATTLINENKTRAQKRIDLMAEDAFYNYPKDERTTYIREQLNLSVGECIYGLGERFTNFVKNGQSVETWNNDGGTCSAQGYKCIPFYVSSRGYGVLVNSSDKVSFEVGSETVSKVAFSVPGERLEYFVIGGENISEVLTNYSLLTGKIALPPAYSFGLWLTTSFTTDYDEKITTSFIDGMEERDIPLQVFHYDCFWMKEYQWCNFEWDTTQFPDPENMLKRIKNRGLKICVWINPYIAQMSKLFDEGLKNGYFIKNPDGSVFQTDEWQPGMAIVDFTNPEACEWYALKLKALCEMGVSVFKTDFGERIPTDVVYFDGSNPIAMHNYYTLLYNKVVFGVLKDYYGENKACVFARSATIGGQQFPVHWGGDCYASYPSMAETLRGGLSLGMSGFGYFSHDISGFESTATPDIYKRWVAFGLLSSHSRLHGGNSYRVPWLFDEEAVDVLRFFTKLKGTLMPYIFSQAVKTSNTGVPMMKAMVIDYNLDPVCRHLDTQYMFGDNLLVAPIFNEEGTAEFYVPEGRWTDIISGRQYDGGRYYNETFDYFALPCLAKQNSIIAYGDFKKDFEYDYLDNTEFVIYELADGRAASCEVYDIDANKVFEISAQRYGNVINVKYTRTNRVFKVKVFGNETVYEKSNDSLEIIINL